LKLKSGAFDSPAPDGLAIMVSAFAPENAATLSAPASTAPFQISVQCLVGFMMYTPSPF